MEFDKANYDEETKQYIIKVKDESIEHIIYRNVNLNTDSLTDSNDNYIKLDETINIENIYENMTNMVEEKVGEWFSGKKITRNFLETKLKKDKKVYLHDSCKAYNMNNSRVIIEDINPKKECDIALSVRGVWFKKTSWGIFISITQIRQDITYDNDSLFENDKKVVEDEETTEKSEEKEEVEFF